VDSLKGDLLFKKNFISVTSSELHALCGTKNPLSQRERERDVRCLPRTVGR